MSTDHSITLRHYKRGDPLACSCRCLALSPRLHGRCKCIGSRWAQLLEAGGIGFEEGGPRRTQASPECRGSKKDPARAGARGESSGLRNRLWTASRVAHLIEEECGVRYHASQAWRILRQLGWSCQRPVGRALERNENKIRWWKQKRWPEIKNPRLKKKAKREGRTIVFIDESGLSERPHRCRTWAPRGQTPVLQYHFNWKMLSAMAGVTWWNFYFRLFLGTFLSPQVVDFLEHLMRHLPRRLLIVWDGLRCHRSRMVWDFVRQHQGRVWL
jgi:transposase